jgi:four helix bundle protein
MPSRPTSRAATPRKPTRRPSPPNAARRPAPDGDAGPPHGGLPEADGPDQEDPALDFPLPDTPPEDALHTEEPAGAASATSVTPLPPGYRGLRVWQKALELAGGIFVLTEGFPSSARDGMAVPMRRASAAIPAAIAEGNVRYTPREYTHYLSQALGTVAEVETLLFLSVRLGLATEAGITPLLGQCVELGRMLRALTRSVQIPRAPIADRPSRRRPPSRD